MQWRPFLTTAGLTGGTGALAELGRAAVPSRANGSKRNGRTGKQTGTCGLALATGTFIAPSGVAFDEMALQQIDHADDHMQECIDNCFEAAQVCEWCADACAGEGDDMARCIRLCRDVADLTSLHARWMARNSGYHRELASICADLCEECAEECEQHDDEHCQACAEVLPECAESCREMASA